MTIKKSTIFVLSIIIVAPIMFFSFFIIKTRSIPELRIILEIEKTKLNNDYIIADSSINKLQNTIEKFNYLNNTDKLIQVFEREREHYIVLITIITFIITIFSIFMILNRFVEKDEYDKIKKDFEKQKIEFDAELKELKFSNLYLSIKSVSDALNEMHNLLYNDGYVSNLDQFELFIEAKLNRHFLELKNHSLSSEKTDTFISGIKNFVIYAIKYANKKKWISSDSYDVNDNPLFKNIIKYYKSSLDPDIFNLFKDRWIKLSKNKINFGDY